MALINDQMEMRFRASIQGVEREVGRLIRINQRASMQMQRDHERASKAAENAWNSNKFGSAIEGQIKNLGPMLSRYAGLIAGIFAGKEALAAAETWTRFSNSLKVAGLNGGQLAQVQEALYTSAVKNGVALEPLGQLYSRLSQSAGELGASQAQLIQFTGGVTAALRVQGGPAEAASGALMQMSQALAGGVVRAEEFNSINEGARPILEAVARGNEKYGGSVSKLRAAMLDGKLTSQDFFASFLAGSASLETQAAKAPLTVGQAMTNLHTAMTKYIGETDAAYGVTERIGQAIKWMADNIDLLKTSLMIVGGVYAATFIPGLARSGAALTAMTIATVRDIAASASHTGALITRTAAIHGVSTASATAAVATRGLSAALGMLGGPVGIAIMGIGAALAYVGTTSVTAAMEAEKLHREIQTLTDKRIAAAAAEGKAAAETGNMTAAQRSALEKTAALTGQVDLLSTAYGRLAAEAKRASLEILNAQVQDAKRQEGQAQKAYAAKQDRETRSAGNMSYDPMDRRTGAGAPAAAIQAKLGAEAARKSAEGKQYAEAQANRKFAEQELAKEQKRDLKDFIPKPAATPPGKPKKGAKSHDNSSASESAIEGAEKAYHQALHNSATTAEERYKYQLEALEEEKADKLDKLKRQVHDKQITESAGKLAAGFVEQEYQQELANAAYARAQELIDKANAIADAELELKTEGQRIEADRLDILADGAKTLKEKHRYEREALIKRQEADDEAFRQQQDQLALEREKEGWTKEVIANLRRQAEANREADKRNQKTDLDQQQKRDGGKTVKEQIEDYAASFGSLSDQLSNIATNGLNNLTTGLTDAIMGSKSLKEAFGDMAKAMIRQLIELGVRFLVFEAMGRAFGMPGLGRAAIGVGKNAKGTDNWQGGLTMVGEAGPELLALPGGSQIAPNNLLRNALKAPAVGGAGGSNTININTTVHANDAVMTGWVGQEIQKSQIETIATAQKMMKRNLVREQRNSF